MQQTTHIYAHNDQANIKDDALKDADLETVTEKIFEA